MKDLSIHQTIIIAIGKMRTVEGMYLLGYLITKIPIDEGHDEILLAWNEVCAERGFPDRNPMKDHFGVRAALEQKKQQALKKVAPEFLELTDKHM